LRTHFLFKKDDVMRLSLALALAPSLLLIGCQKGDQISSEAQAATTQAAGPIVVELYQSQGCSSCPPANSALNAEAGRSDVIALNFSVTYWDRLGWKDIFGDPAYTQRQYNYAKALKADGVFTPQVIMNGKRSLIGNQPGEISKAIAATAPLRGGPVITGSAGKASIGAGNGAATIWLVRYDPRIQNVAIKAGENSGRTLPHKNIVRQLVKLGDWRGQAVTYTLPKSPSASYKSVILVEQVAGGAIYSAKVL
jgi:hypothetical protein